MSATGNFISRPESNTPSYRRQAILGRVYSLTPIDTQPGVENDGQIVINFPAMPEAITLSRVANYVNAARTPATPDGFHYYEGTDPIKIPVKFSLHAFDREFCGPDGPVALINTAARLHALAMPIVNGSQVRAQSGFNMTPAAPPADGSSDAAVAAKGASGAAQKESHITPNSDVRWYFPPACRLDIMFASYGGKRLGILCDGFIDQVTVVLRGPWLQGTDPSRLLNLPSFADYEFTFVHQPGYTNMTRDGSLNRVYGSSSRSIYDRLYNTVGLVDDAVRVVDINGNSLTGLPGTF